MNEKLKTLTLSAKDISFPFFIACVLDSLDSRRSAIFNKPYISRIYNFRNEQFESYLLKKYKSYFNEYSSCISSFENTSMDSSDLPIWQIWLQGVNRAPSFVRTLYERVDANAHSRPIHRLSADEISDYIDLPGKIVDRYRNGIISPAHFSDIVRVGLLRDYGGIWLDSSVLVTSTIPNSVFDTQFYSVKEIDPDFPLRPKCVNSTNWGTYFMAARPHSPLYSFMWDVLVRYFMEHDHMFEYLVPNHFYYLAFSCIKQFSKEYKKIEPNNYYCEMLGPLLEKGICTKKHITQLDKMLSSDTYVFKLNTKTKYAAKLNEGCLGDDLASLIFVDKLADK